jgi:hypothetical protein
MSDTQTTMKCDYFITSPYIDAYDVSYGTMSALHPAVDFEEFQRRMRIQAHNWGPESIGRTILKGLKPAEYVHGPPLSIEWVLAFGTFGTQHYIAVQRDDEIVTIEVEDKCIGEEWNVT